MRNVKACNNITEFMQFLFVDAFKVTYCVYKAVLTVILIIAKDGIFIAAYNFSSYSFINNRFSSIFVRY